MTQATWTSKSAHTETLGDSLTKLMRDNVLRVGLVLFGMTVFIAAAEAKTPINQLDLTNLPQLVSQVANQSALQVGPQALTTQTISNHRKARQYLTSDDFAAQAAPNNVLNSPAARFLAGRLN
ncbi:MAG: hypothetical protein AAF221_04040 [Pseudomonadota bacterium]